MLDVGSVHLLLYIVSCGQAALALLFTFQNLFPSELDFCSVHFLFHILFDLVNWSFHGTATNEQLFNTMLVHQANKAYNRSTSCTSTIPYSSLIPYYKSIITLV